MYFANLWLLALATALAIPTLIHLWRRKRGEVRWAAMSLLQSALQKQSRTRRWSHWLLLLLRCTILALLAIAVSAPYTLEETRASSESRRDRVLNVVVFDDSRSMNFTGNGKSAFSTAKSKATSIIEKGNAGDGFCLLRMTDSTRPIVDVPSFDQAAVLNVLQHLDPTQQQENVDQSFQTAFSIVQQHADPKRFDRVVIHVLSDLAGNRWRELDFNPGLFELPGIAATVMVHNCASPTARPNLAILNLDAPDCVLGPGEITIRCELAGYQLENPQSEQLVISLDEETIFQELVEVDGNKSVQIEFRHRIDTPGIYQLTAKYGSDGLSDDNRRFKIIESKSTATVLMIEGRSGEARSLKTALEVGPAGAAQFDITVTGIDAFRQSAYEGYDIVVYCNVPTLTKEDSQKIERMLSSGTSVIISAGDLLEPDSYNAARTSNNQPLFPVEFIGPSATELVAYDPLEYQHPVTSIFKNQPDSGLLDAPNWRFMTSTLRPQRNTRTIMDFQNLQPAIVEESYRKSKLIINHGSFSQLSKDMTTEPPTPWTAIDIWRSFVPLVKRLFVWSVSNHNADLTGKPPTRFSGQLSESPSSVHLLGAENEKIKCDWFNTDSSWVSRELTRAGFYQLVVNEVGIDRWFAVNVHQGQSDTRSIDMQKLPDWIDKRQPGERVDNKMTYTVQTKRWKMFPFFLALLLLVLVETVWMARLDRYR